MQYQYTIILAETSFCFEAEEPFLVEELMDRYTAESVTEPDFKICVRNEDLPELPLKDLVMQYNKGLWYQGTDANGESYTAFVSRTFYDTEGENQEPGAVCIRRGNFLEIFPFPGKEELYRDLYHCFVAINFSSLLLEKGALSFHSSYLKYNDQCILFTGPSGIGKSTQAALWEKYRGAKLLNGDRSIIKNTKNGICAFGLPQCGSSQTSWNETLPIRAIVILSQGPEDIVSRAAAAKCMSMLYFQCAIERWNPKEAEAGYRLIENLMAEVPILTLSCTPTVHAVEVLEQYLCQMEETRNG